MFRNHSVQVGPLICWRCHVGLHALATVTDPGLDAKPHARVVIRQRGLSTIGDPPNRWFLCWSPFFKTNRKQVPPKLTHPDQRSRVLSPVCGICSYGRGPRAIWLTSSARRVLKDLPVGVPGERSHLLTRTHVHVDTSSNLELLSQKVFNRPTRCQIRKPLARLMHVSAILHQLEDPATIWDTPASNWCKAKFIHPHSFTVSIHMGVSFCWHFCLKLFSFSGGPKGTPLPLISARYGKAISKCQKWQPALALLADARDKSLANAARPDE